MSTATAYVDIIARAAKVLIQKERRDAPTALQEQPCGPYKREIAEMIRWLFNEDKPDALKDLDEAMAVERNITKRTS